jgi:ribonuclease HI
MHTIISDGGNKDYIPYGSYKILDDYGNLIAHRHIVFGYGTSNLAEYSSMIAGVRRARDIGCKDIVIFTDSLLVKNQVEGNWECNYDYLRSARDKLRDLLKSFLSWKITKVSRNIIVAQLGH